MRPPGYDKAMKPFGQEEDVPELPDLDEVEHHLPLDRDGSRMSKETIYLLYTGYQWFNYHERKLSQDEVLSVISRELYDGEKIYRKNALFKGFDDPANEIRANLDRLNDEWKTILAERFGRWFHKLLNENSAASSKAAFYRGYEGRAYSAATTFSHCKMEHTQLEHYQLAFHYSIVEWCGDIPGASELLADFYGHQNPSDLVKRTIAENTQKVKSKNHIVAKEASQMAWADREWFEKKAKDAVWAWKRGGGWPAYVGTENDLDKMVAQSMNDSAIR